MGGDDAMDSSYASEPVKPPAEKPAENESVDQEEAEANTALVDNKILSPEGEPLKEGDEIVVRVVKNYGDQSEIEYAPKKGGGETETASTASPEDELAALDKENV